MGVILSLSPKSFKSLYTHKILERNVNFFTLIPDKLGHFLFPNGLNTSTRFD